MKQAFGESISLLLSAMKGDHIDPNRDIQAGGNCAKEKTPQGLLLQTAWFTLRAPVALATDIRTVQELLGHSDVHPALIYTHVLKVATGQTTSPHESITDEQEMLALRRGKRKPAIGPKQSPVPIAYSSPNNQSLATLSRAFAFNNEVSMIPSPAHAELIATYRRAQADAAHKFGLIQAVANKGPKAIHAAVETSAKAAKRRDSFAKKLRALGVDLSE